MTATPYNTVVQLIPTQFSQIVTTWYANPSTCCPKWVKYGGTLISNALSVLTTPIAMLCDLIASIVFKLWALCSAAERKDELNEKSWESFKSGTLGGILFIFLAIIRVVNPSHAHE